MIVAILVLAAVPAVINTVDEVTGKVANAYKMRKLAKKVADTNEDLVLVKPPEMIFTESEINRGSKEDIVAAQRRAEELKALWPKCGCGSLQTIGGG